MINQHSNIPIIKINAQDTKTTICNTLVGQQIK